MIGCVPSDNVLRIARHGGIQGVAADPDGMESRRCLVSVKMEGGCGMGEQKGGGGGGGNEEGGTS